MTVKGIIIKQDKDNVAVVADTVKKGDLVSCRSGSHVMEITALEEIPIYHKICLTDLKKGDIVVKYGEGIGRVMEDVKRGSYIHVHNLGLLREDRV